MFVVNLLCVLLVFALYLCSFTNSVPDVFGLLPVCVLCCLTSVHVASSLSLDANRKPPAQPEQSPTKPVDSVDSADKTHANTQSISDKTENGLHDTSSKPQAAISETLIGGDVTERLRTLSSSGADARSRCSLDLDSVDIEKYTDVSFEEESFGMLSCWLGSRN